MKTIIVVKRSHDFMASIEGSRDKWGCGRSEREAIGALVVAWGEDLKLKIKMPYRIRVEVDPDSTKWTTSKGTYKKLAEVQS